MTQKKQCFVTLTSNATSHVSQSFIIPKPVRSVFSQSPPPSPLLSFVKNDVN